MNLSDVLWILFWQHREEHFTFVSSLCFCVQIKLKKKRTMFVFSFLNFIITALWLYAYMNQVSC